MRLAVIPVTEIKILKKDTNHVPPVLEVLSRKDYHLNNRGTNKAMSVKEKYVASATPFDSIYVVPTNVSAIQVLPSEDNEVTRLGLLTQLPEGAELQIAGPGFNDLTLRVKCGSAFYYVFLDDLELVRKRTAYACA
jgi:hypothetical protein